MFCSNITQPCEHISFVFSHSHYNLNETWLSARPQENSSLTNNRFIFTSSSIREKLSSYWEETVHLVSFTHFSKRQASVGGEFRHLNWHQVISTTCKLRAVQTGRGRALEATSLRSIPPSPHFFESRRILGLTKSDTKITDETTILRSAEKIVSLWACPLSLNLGIRCS